MYTYLENSPNNNFVTTWSSQRSLISVKVFGVFWQQTFQGGHFHVNFCFNISGSYFLQSIHHWLQSFILRVFFYTGKMIFCHKWQFFSYCNWFYHMSITNLNFESTNLKWRFFILVYIMENFAVCKKILKSLYFTKNASFKINTFVITLDFFPIICFLPS